MFPTDQGLVYARAMADPLSYTVSVCKSCLKGQDFKPKKFRRKLTDELGSRLAPGTDLEVEITSCLKICPRKNIAFALRTKAEKTDAHSVRTTSRTPDLDGVTNEVLSLLGARTSAKGPR